MAFDKTGYMYHDFIWQLQFGNYGLPCVLITYVLHDTFMRDVSDVTSSKCTITLQRGQILIHLRWPVFL